MAVTVKPKRAEEPKAKRKVQSVAGARQRGRTLTAELLANSTARPGGRQKNTARPTFHVLVSRSRLGPWLGMIVDPSGQPSNGRYGASWREARAAALAAAQRRAEGLGAVVVAPDLALDPERSAPP